MAIQHKFNADYLGRQENILLFEAGFIPRMEEGKKYTVVLKDVEGIRSDEQNKKLWATISEIAERTKQDVWDLYINGLEETETRYEEIYIIPEAFNALAESFRAIKVVGSIKIDGKHMLVCKCFVGSSKFTTQEMCQLIDYFEITLNELRKDYANV